MDVGSSGRPARDRVRLQEPAEFGRVEADTHEDDATERLAVRAAVFECQRHRSHRH
jgi:hypothetical protein